MTRNKYDPDKFRAYSARNNENSSESRRKWNKENRKAGNIVAIDGEGITDSDTGNHRYILLAASNGHSVEHHNLPTSHCLEFLFDLPSRALLVGYSINYDINMMLKDLPESNLRELWEDGATRWRMYSIRWIPSKKFSVTRMGETRVVWDVFGFFQCSFVKALEQWDISTPKHRQKILDMKEQRGNFTDDQEADIKDYCLDECLLLVQIVSKLLSCTEEVGLSLRSYHGAGSVASAIFTKFGIKQFMGTPPESVFRAALRGYFGGRFENAAVGIIDGPIYSYDINSAYVAEIATLPCLKHANWKEIENPKEIDDFSLYHINWKLHKDDFRWPPFPWRHADNRICYPTQGSGWYWGKEINAARKLISRRSRIRVDKGFLLERRCNHQPFTFVHRLYEERRILKNQGNFGQIVLKLGLNSLYGKTAQSISAGKKKPIYQSYIWAGMITSGCRAKILDAVRTNPNDVVAIATDGIVTKSRLPIKVGTDLGEWEFTGPISSIFLAQPGVYAYKADCKTFPKTRGFSIRELRFEDLESEFLRNGWLGVHSISVTRFNGLGASLATKKPLFNWRKWTKRDKRISFAPSSRIPLECLTSPKSKWSKPGTSNFDLIAAHFDDRILEINPELESSSYKMKSEWENMFEEPGKVTFMEMMDQPDLVGDMNV